MVFDALLKGLNDCAQLLKVPVNPEIIPSPEAGNVGAVAHNGFFRGDFGIYDRKGFRIDFHGLVLRFDNERVARVRVGSNNASPWAMFLFASVMRVNLLQPVPAAYGVPSLEN